MTEPSKENDAHQDEIELMLFSAWDAAAAAYQKGFDTAVGGVLCMIKSHKDDKTLAHMTREQALQLIIEILES